MNRSTIAPAPVRTEIVVRAEPARAFEVFTAGMGRWWNRSYSIGTAPLKEVVVEPRAGGRWYERGEDGSECGWGKVLIWEPPKRVVFAWQINTDWRYDENVLTELEIRFAPEGKGETRVSLEHRGLEQLGERAQLAAESFASPEGWPGLLRRYAEAI
jgi:uncharacterized protein YndB with AHSA1/START domain